MKKLLKRVFPPEFFRSPAYARALVLAVVYVGVALAQLFTFEKFPSTVAEWSLPGGQIVDVIVACVLPLLAIAALPFLISMRLSKWSRKVSGVMVIVTPAVWAALSAWLVATAEDGVNAGLFGETIHTSANLLLLLFTVLWLWAAVLCVRELPPRRK